MFKKCLTIFTLFFLSMNSWAAYDPEKIMQGLSQNKALFLIDTWAKTDNTSTWIAQTQIKLGSISVDNIKTELSSPYINFKQKNLAKERCNALANIAISPESVADKKKITDTINASTVRHIIKYTDINTQRFEIEPIMKGVFVKLHCRIKPLKNI